MEDEECLPENSSLKLYLQNLGFSGLQVRKNAPQNTSGIRFEVPKPKSKHPYVETIDANVIDQINIIVSSRMLFDEDILNVEKLLSNFKIVRNGIMKSMFKNELILAVIFLGLGLYWLIGYYAFFIVSSFYAYMAADYLKCNHFHRTRLKKLTSILQANFILLKKTVKFIEENRLIEANNKSKNISTEFMEGFNFYKNFKSDFLLMINEMIDILIKSTQGLIKNIPLCDYIENPEYYLCNNLNENYELVNLSKLYEIYLLVQSEFLQRLILSLIPNIKLSNKNDFHEFNKILTEACVSSLKIKNKLNKKFKFIFLNGIHSPNYKVEFKLPVKNITSENRYLGDFILNIHETSKTFQNLLLQSRIIEENLISNEIPVFVEQELLKMQSDLTNCQRNINESLILLKRANVTNSLEKCDEVKIQEEEKVENSNEGLNKIMVGYTDFNPKVEDEIFEAYFTNENACDQSEIYTWNSEEKWRKELEKEYCKSVMEELKIKLVEKDKCWKKREKELLKKKGLIEESEDLLKDEYKQNSESLDEKGTPLSGIEKPDLQMPLECQKVYVNCEFNDANNYTDLITTEKNKSEKKFDNQSINLVKPECQIHFHDSVKHHTDANCLKIAENSEEPTYLKNEDFENNDGSFMYAFNKCLMNDFNQARKEIFKSFPLEEEVFYTVTEDDESQG